MPEISVILPLYNAETTVAAAVRSILHQTLTDFELIVVDDGSTDRSADVVSSFDDDRISLIRKQHEGVAQTANRGLQVAQSSMIARMDADDIAAPERLHQQLQYLRNHRLDVVGSNVRIATKTGHAVPQMARYEQWINEETATHDEIMALRFVEFPLVNPTLLAKRDYFELQFSDGAFPEDYELMLKAASRGMTFGKVPQPLLDWTESDSRLTRTGKRYTDEAFMDCRRHFFRQDILPDVTVVDLWGGGRTGKQWFRWLQSEGIVVRRMIDVKPSPAGRTIAGVPVVHFDAMPAFDGTLLVSAVGAMGARAQIRAHAEQRGYVAGQNLWFVA